MEGISIKSGGLLFSMPDGYCSDLSIYIYQCVKNGTFEKPNYKVMKEEKSLIDHVSDCKKLDIPRNQIDRLSVHNNTGHCYLWYPIYVAEEGDTLYAPTMEKDEQK